MTPLESFYPEAVALARRYASTFPDAVAKAVLSARGMSSASRYLKREMPLSTHAAERIMYDVEQLLNLASHWFPFSTLETKPNSEDPAYNFDDLHPRTNAMKGFLRNAGQGIYHAGQSLTQNPWACGWCADVRQIYEPVAAINIAAPRITLRGYI